MAPHVLRHPAAGRLPLPRRPPLCLEADAGQGRRTGIHLLSSGRSWSIFYFAGNTNPEVPGSGRLFRHHASGLWATTCAGRPSSPWRSMGIRVEYSHHEVAQSQHEIDLRYDEALRMADKVHDLQDDRQGDRHARTASTPPSCPSPSSASTAAACTPTSPCSRTARTPSTTPATRTTSPPWPRATSPGCSGTPGRSPPSATSGSTPTSAWCRATRPRSISPGPGATAPTMIRVPMYKPGKEAATRIEYRAPDPACNPYLAFAVMLAAGLKGVEDNYPLPDPVEQDIYHMSEAERGTPGHRGRLPGSLYEAVTGHGAERAGAGDPGRPHLQQVHRQQTDRVGQLPHARERSTKSTGTCPSSRAGSRPPWLCNPLPQ